ncbi:MAG: glycosyltransferase family 2 protein [Ilumatobacteraceae bacterium]
MSDVTWPSVSVVMPVRNEGLHLRDAVAAVLAQEYPGEFDVWVAVAPSVDDTSAILDELVASDPRVHRVENPAGVTPAGLNAAIRASTGEVVVRVDGHVTLPEGYITRAVETMRRTGAVNVGGRQLAVGVSPFEVAVAAVMMSMVGSGGATYRTGSEEGPVDTVFLGVFDRAAGDAVGWFDESLIRNQDYELNVRLRAAGGVVFFDPTLEVLYRPRPSLRAVARQYREYGMFKARVMRMHGDSIRLRQVVPPVMSLALLVSAVLGVWWRLAWLVPAAYLAAVGVLVRGLVGIRVRALVIAPAMHLSWSWGLLRGFMRR